MLKFLQMNISYFVCQCKWSKDFLGTWLPTIVLGKRKLLFNIVYNSLQFLRYICILLQNTVRTFSGPEERDHCMAGVYLKKWWQSYFSSLPAEPEAGAAAAWAAGASVVFYFSSELPPPTPKIQSPPRHPIGKIRVIKYLSFNLYSTESRAKYLGMIY